VRSRQLLSMTPPMASPSEPATQEDYRDRCERLTGHSSARMPGLSLRPHDQRQTIAEATFSPAIDNTS